MKSNIALFGGSFDPVHVGHTAIIEALKKLPYIDLVVVMPAYLNPFKSSFTASASQRIEWLQKLYKDDPKVHISSFEADQNRKVPTIESVIHLKKFYDTVYLTIGADNLASLNKWYEYDKLKELVKIIVASRDDIQIDQEFIPLHVTMDISSTQLRQKMDKQYLPQQIADEIENFYKEHNAQKN